MASAVAWGAAVLEKCISEDNGDKLKLASLGMRPFRGLRYGCVRLGQVYE